MRSRRSDAARITPQCPCRSPLAGDALARHACARTAAFLSTVRTGSHRTPSRHACEGRHRTSPAASPLRRQAGRELLCACGAPARFSLVARPVDPASPPHRGPGSAAGHRDPHSVRNRCAVARAHELRASDVQSRVWSGIARAVCHRSQTDVAPSAFRVSTILASKNLDHSSVLVEKVHLRFSVRRHFQQDPLVAEGVHESEC